MSSHSRAFALAIGFPIAAALSSLTSLSRFDASCLAFPPHLAEEEDLVESSLEDSYQDPNKPVRLNYGLGIFMVVIFATSIGAQWLPGWGPEAVAVSTVSVSIGFMAANTIHRLFGMITEIIARKSDGTLALKTIEAKSLRYRIGSATIILICTSLVPMAIYIPSLSFYLWTVLAILTPYPFSLLFNGTKGRSKPFKIVMLVFCGAVGVTMSLVAAVYGITQIEFVKGCLESSKKDQTETKESPASVQAVAGILTCQPLMLCGIIVGTMVAALYRVDVVLARTKKVNGSAGFKILEEYEPRIPIQGELTISQAEDEAGETEPGIGEPVVVPTFAGLLRAHCEDRRNGTSQRVVKPFYSALAMGVTVLILSSTSSIWSRACEHDLVQKSDVCMDRDSGPFLSLIGAILVCPFVISIVIAIAAWSRGESAMVWNYRADWSAPASADGQNSSISKEKVSVDDVEEGRSLL